MVFDFNYHTHTFHCGHATGTPEEYIKRAIAFGVKYMGFSDHIPFMFPDGHESPYRVPMSEGNEYISEISALREKYKEKINISIGFEMEYYPLHFEKMLKTARKFGAEYLILGQHFIHSKDTDGVYIFRENGSAEDFAEYVNCVTAAIKSGVFTYVAHPDIFNYTGSDDIYLKQMEKICIASKKYDIPLEINCLGISDNRHYPKELFWKLAGEKRAPVTIGFDAHNTQAAYNAEALKKAEDLIKKYNLNYIGMPKLKNIAL